MGLMGLATSPKMTQERYLMREREREREGERELLYNINYIFRKNDMFIIFLAHIFYTIFQFDV